MAFPVLAATGTAHETAADANTKLVNKPAHSAGDRLVLYMAWDGNPAISSISAVGSDNWVLVGDRAASDGIDTWLFVYEIVSATAVGAAADVTVTFAAAASEMGVAQIRAYSGSHATEPLAIAEAVASTVNVSGPLLDPANWAVEDTRWIAVGGYNGNPTISTFPTGYGDTAALTNANTNGTGMGIAELNAAAASEDPSAFVITASRAWAAFTLAMRPAAGGAAPQIARPTADVFVGAGWIDEGGATTNLFESIDEASASDTDYARSPNSPSSSVYVATLDPAALTDPQVSTGHVLRYRYDKEIVSGSPTLNLTVQLRQAYVSEASQGTLIASATHSNIADAPADGTLTLSGAEADAITDYTDLHVRVVFTQA